MLVLFDQYQIKATFATVGFLFCENKEELIALIPDTKPEYAEKNKSPFENSYIDRYVGENEKNDPIHFAPSIIEEIKSYSTHEIATHTLSHIFINECLNPSLAFAQDLDAAVKIAKSRGYDLQSIVFPKNQYSNKTLSICAERGLRTFRGNEQNLFYAHDTLKGFPTLKRAGRLLDTYLKLGNHHTYPAVSLDKEALINIPSSRFLRPITSKTRFLYNFQLDRIKSQMKYAAKHNEVFHLWWHPHNFSSDLTTNLKMLTQILSYHQELRDDFGFESMRMKDF